ncbi:very short patch repair endonuclease [Dyadobacter bucti]|uniref:very short patch repair endonuclease n=1 Tax=Dyadobacter bucti TaxID=2572203 RepID=UPI0011080BA2|nr:very short patch repair endonuclease [Dyadobacter bucti]
MGDKSEKHIQVPRFNIDNGFVTSNVRSRLMGKIKGKDTKSEKALRKVLWGLGIRYRKNDPRLPGKPDIVIPRAKLIIFVDGEFWHGYNWKEKKDKIKSNREFWIPKIERNMQRDQMNNKLLSQNGWTVLRFWDQELKKEFGMCLKKVLSFLD